MYLPVPVMTEGSSFMTFVNHLAQVRLCPVRFVNGSDGFMFCCIISVYNEHLNIFYTKVYRRILGPVYDNEKENWRILTNKEIYARVKKPTIIETVSLNRLRWFGYVQRMEGNGIPKRVLYMNPGTTRLRGRQRNKWQDEVREDGRIVGGEGWQEKEHNREEWKKLLRTARDRCILHMPME